MDGGKLQESTLQEGKHHGSTAEQGATSERATKRSIRSLVVDDYPLFRQGVAKILNRSGAIEVVGLAEDGEVAIRLCKELMPDVVLMDMSMPVMNGLQATRQLKMNHPDVKILLLTALDTEPDLYDAVRAGASGYLLKSAPPSEVIDSIERVMAGEVVIPPNLAVLMLTEMSRAVSCETQGTEQGELTQFEYEVLRHLSVGSKPSEIASRLECTEGTVRRQERCIVRKFQRLNRCNTSFSGSKNVSGH